MRKYKIEIKEISTRIVEQQARDLETALEKVREKYDREDIVLDYDDFNYVEFKKYSNNIIKEDLNINIKFDKQNDKVLIGNEKYKCKNFEDLSFAFNDFISNKLDTITLSCKTKNERSDR